MKKATTLLLVALTILSTTVASQTLDKAALYQRVFKTAPNNRPQTLTVSVVIDGKNIGSSEIIYLPFTADIQMSVKRWRSIFEDFFSNEKMTLFLESQTQDGYWNRVSLEQQGFRFKYDPQTLELSIETPMSYRKKMDFYINGKPRELPKEAYTKVDDISGYINLLGNGSLFNNSANTSELNVAWRSNLYANEWVFQSEGAVTNLDGTYVSALRLIKDDNVNKIRYYTGTFAPGIFRDASVVPEINGFGFRKQWLDQQDYYPFYKHQVNLTLKERSQLQFSINNSVFLTQDFEPGEYDFHDFPEQYGVNRFLISRVKNGVTENIVEDVYFKDERIIDARQSEFGMSVGYPFKQSLRLDNIDTSAPSLISYYRYGYSRDQNASVFFQTLPGYYNVGALLQEQFTMGLFEQTLHRSQNQSDTGYSLQLAMSGYFLKDTPFPWQQSYQVTFTTNTSTYGTNVANSTNPIAYELSPSVYWLLDDVTRVQTQLFFQKNRTAGRLITGYELTGYWNFSSHYVFASYRQTLDAIGSNTPIFSLGFTWTDSAQSQKIDATIDSSPQTNIRWSSQTLDYNKFNSYGDLRYRSVSDYQVSLTGRLQDTYSTLTRKQTGSGTELNMTLSNQGQRGYFQTDFRQSENGVWSNQYGFGTSLVFAGGRFGVSQPIQDSFVLLYPSKSLENQVIEFSQGVKIDAWGPAVMIYLQSYRDNRISVTDARVPLGVDLGKQSFILRPKYGSGTAIKVGEEGNILILGTFKDAANQPVEFIYGKMISLTDPTASQKEVFSNRKGQFSLLGLTPGTYEITFYSQSAKPVQFTIPENAVSPYNVGIIKVQE